MNAMLFEVSVRLAVAMFEAETENYLRDYDARLRQQGLDLSTYFKYTGMNLDSLRAQLRPQAEKQFKTRLALEKIASLENISVSDEDIEAEYNKIADMYHTPIEEVKKLVAKDDIAADLKVKGAMDIVKANAVIEETKPTKKTTAKKSAAKKTADKSDDTEAVKPAKKTTAKKATVKADVEEKVPVKKTAARKTTKKTDAE